MHTSHWGVDEVLVYRALLEEPDAAIAAITICPRTRPGEVHLVVRYAGRSGQVRVHRGVMHAAGCAGRPMRVAGYQVSGREAFITLGFGRTTPGFRAMERFGLPIRLQAWGVTVLSGARVRVHAVCRQVGGTLVIVGGAWLRVATPGGGLQLRIPFCRVVPATRDAQPAQVRARGAVSGLAVGPGGQITGELAVTVRWEPRPVVPPASPGLVRVTALFARVVCVTAEPCGNENVLAQGTLELDLYWTDQRGRSRWTGQQAAFSGMLTLAGLQPGDRLEVTAEVQRVGHRLSRDQVRAHLLVALRLTALRPAEVPLGGAVYRLEQLVGRAAATAEVEVALSADPPSLAGAAPPTGPASLAGPTVTAEIPLPGPVRQILSVTVTGRDISALVRLEAHGLTIIRGRSGEEAGSPGCITASPILRENQWYLRVSLCGNAEN